MDAPPPEVVEELRFYYERNEQAGRYRQPVYGADQVDRLGALL